jgi:hypothetical protein
VTGKVFGAVLRRTWFLRLLAALGVVGAVEVFGSAAFAQDPLEHGFVEPCTMSNVQERHLDCEVCASAFGSRACDEKLEPRGYAKRCRTRGDHAEWDEIWCAPHRAPEKKKADGPWGLLLGVAVTIAAAVLVMRVISGRAKG